MFRAINERAAEFPPLPVPAPFNPHAAWRYTLLTGLAPGLLILALMPFVPESRVWRDKKRAGLLQRARFAALFAGDLRRTTVVTALLSLCGYAAAFGALQLTPNQIMRALPAVKPVLAAAADAKKAADAGEERKRTLQAKVATAALTPSEAEAAKAELVAATAAQRDAVAAAEAAKATADQSTADTTGQLQLVQELGGLTGRIVLASLLALLPSRVILRLFLVPGVVLFPVTYLVLVHGDYNPFIAAVFCCGLVTVAQFSLISEYLPKVFPLHLRGVGGSFATNVGGRMLGTMAATLNTELLSTPAAFGSVATAAAAIGGTVYAVALAASFLFPTPVTEPSADKAETVVR